MANIPVTLAVKSVPASGDENGSPTNDMDHWIDQADERTRPNKHPHDESRKVIPPDVQEQRKAKPDRRL